MEMAGVKASEQRVFHCYRILYNRFLFITSIKSKLITLDNRNISDRIVVIQKNDLGAIPNDEVGPGRLSPEDLPGTDLR